MGSREKEQAPMTYKEYATWPEGKRCEVLDGNIISMAPSPTPEHQSISLQLSIEFGMYFRGKDCRVLAAPIDVYLFEDHRKGWMDENVRNWVCPDLVVICDKNKIQKKPHCRCSRFGHRDLVSRYGQNRPDGQTDRVRAGWGEGILDR